MTNEQMVNKPLADTPVTLRALIIRLAAFLRYLVGQWKIILLVAILGALTGLCYAWLRKPVYHATITFVVDEPQSGGGLGAYAGVAAQFGINLGGLGGSSGLFAGDNIIQFIRSRKMIQKTLLSPARIDGTDELLVDRYVSFRQLRKKWAKDQRLSNFRFRDSSGIYLQDSLLAEFYKDIVKYRVEVAKPDRKLSIIALDTHTSDEQFSKAFAEKLLENVQDFYTRTRIRKSQENLETLTRQVDSVRRELNAAIGGVASATEANPNPNAAFIRLKVPSQRRTVDVQANTAILTELVKNQELTRMELQNNTPLIQVIDSPLLPLHKEKTGKLTGMLVGAFLAGMLCCVYLAARKLWQSEIQLLHIR